MAFEKLKIVMNNQSGTLTVPDVTVRWFGKEAFTLDRSPPSSSQPLPSDPKQPFSIDPSTKDPANAKWRIAILKFDKTLQAKQNWQATFKGGTTLTQVMQVENDIGPMDLTIELSCTESAQISNQVKQVLVGLAESAVAVVTAVFLSIRRLFSAVGRAGT